MTAHGLMGRTGELAIHVTAHLGIVVLVGVILAVTLPVRLLIGTYRIARSAVRGPGRGETDADRRQA
jgi:hypothetical protein